MSNKENKDNLMMELDVLKSQLEELERAKSQMNLRMQELESARLAIIGISESNSSEIMIPVGAGVFFKGKVIDVKSAIVSIGAGISAEKSIVDTKSYLDSETKKTMETISQINSEIDSFQKKSSNMLSNIQSTQKQIPKN